MVDLSYDECSLGFRYKGDSFFLTSVYETGSILIVSSAK